MLSRFNILLQFVCVRDNVLFAILFFAKTQCARHVLFSGVCFYLSHEFNNEILVNNEGQGF